MKYVAEIAQTSYLTIEFELEGDEPPTELHVLDAMSYVENHMDTVVSDEVITYIEDEDGNEITLTQES